MSDIKKFLDQSGVSTLWNRVAEEVAKVDNKVAANATKISTLEGKVSALEESAYDDSEVRGLIKTNQDAISVLNSDVNTEGSVAYTATAIAVAKVAEIVAGADANFDTLKEIADWILNDTTGAADMANDIAELQNLVGSVAVATQISNAIDNALKIDGIDKYALASDLNNLASRVKTLEDAGYVTQEAVNTGVNEAKRYADSLAVNYDSSGSAAQALIDAKSYTDTEINTKIIALTATEINNAINSTIN